jgi:hypothetical protein
MVEWDFSLPALAGSEPDPEPGHPMDNFRPMPSAGDSPMMTYCLKCLEPMTLLEALDHDCGRPMPKAGHL